MLNRRLSTVEMTVLGMTWLRGPCTVYAVMKELSASESTYHRSRAGTAYSVSSRLVGLGLLERDDDDRVQITPAGLERLREWIGPDVPMLDVAHSADLLRLRFFFLEALAPEQRVEFIDRSLASLREFEARCLALIPENEKLRDYFGLLATLNSVLETRSRIRWLNLVREYVVSPLAQDSNWTEEVLKALRHAD